MVIAETREEYRRAFYAWTVACRIRRAMRGVGPVKKWYDECRVMLTRAERAHRRALRDRTEAYRRIFRIWDEIVKTERTPARLIGEYSACLTEIKQLNGA